jgi:leader peptidase (prepilin peptidase)/N-methyltransferase
MNVSLAALALAPALAIGSFLNVVAARLPAKRSLVRPGSACPACDTPIAWYDNVPVLSWLLLRGRCRRCRAGISMQYPLVELVTALIWGWCVWRFGPTWQALSGALFGTILLGIAMTDAREYIIPDEFSLGGLGVGLLLSLAGGVDGVLFSVVGAVTGFVLLWTVGELGARIFKKEAMGGGDIKMMAMVGAFVGWQGVLLTVFLGALLGTLIFGPLSLLGREKQVPFGIFLSLGAAATWLAGPTVIAWYRTFVLQS